MCNYNRIQQIMRKLKRKDGLMAEKLLPPAYGDRQTDRETDRETDRPLKKELLGKLKHATGA